MGATSDGMGAVGETPGDGMGEVGETPGDVMTMEGDAVAGSGSVGDERSVFGTVWSGVSSTDTSGVGGRSFGSLGELRISQSTSDDAGRIDTAEGVSSSPADGENSGAGVEVASSPGSTVSNDGLISASVTALSETSSVVTGSVAVPS